MSTHRYHRRDLNADLLRVALGIAACVTPMFFIEAGATAAYILGVFAAFFGLFGLRTLMQMRTTVTLDESGITTKGWSRAHIPWNSLDTLKLSYFSTRRDREAGWMQLTLRSAEHRIAIHSTLEGFEDLCRLAFQAARKNDVELSDATARSFAVIGLGDVGLSTPTDATPAALSGWGNPADWRR